MDTVIFYENKNCQSWFHGDFKCIVHPKISILCSFTHPHVILKNLHTYFFLLCNTEDNVLKISVFFVYKNKVVLDPIYLHCMGIKLTNSSKSLILYSENHTGL